MKISRVTVLVLVLVWGAILLVPSLNYYFRLQMRNESEQGEALAIFTQPDYVPNFWEKVARRFPDNRDVLYQAAQEYPRSEDDDDMPVKPYQIASNLPPSVVFPGRFASDVRFERVRRIELLRRKFPDDTFLIAAEIRARLASFEYERIGGELADVTPKDKRPPGYISPEKNGEKISFTPADFQKAIELCRLGQKREPENGYYDWMECYFLMHSWRDKEAFKALEAVGHKKQYDDGVLDEICAEINALSIAWGRPLLYEEKIGPLSPIGLPQYARQRELARVISWQAIKAQRRGEHAQAIGIAAALARAAGRMRDNSRSYIDGLVAIAIEAVGWGSLTHGWRAAFPRTMQGEEQKKKQYEILQAYLAKHGRRALAVEAAQGEILNSNFISQSHENINRGTFGTSYPVVFSALLLWASGMKLLLLLTLPLFVLVLMAWGKRIGLLRRWLHWDESGADEVPPVREVWQGVLACVGLRAWAMALCGFLLISLVEVVFLGGWATFSQQSQDVPFLKLLFQEEAPVRYWSPWAQLYFSLIDVVYIDSAWRIVVFCSPILFGTLYVAWRAIEWQRHRNGERVKWLSFGRMVDFIIMLLLIWSFFVQAFGKDASEDPSTRLIFALITLVCAAVLLGEKILAWRKRPRRRAAVRYGLRLLQCSLLSWLVAGSVIYLLTLVATATVRREADRAIDRVVAIGEVQMSKELDKVENEFVNSL